MRGCEFGGTPESVRASRVMSLALRSLFLFFRLRLVRCALNHVGQGRRGSRPSRLVHRTLQRVLQCAKRLLQSGLSVELRERRHAEFQLHVQHIKLIDSSGLQLRFDRLLLLSFGGEQRIARGQLFPRDSICRDRAVDLTDDFRLQLGETGGGFFTARFRLGNRPLILIEHGQLECDAQRPFVVALVELIAGVQVNVGKLFRDLQPKLGLGGCVVGQRAENVGPHAQRDVTGNSTPSSALALTPRDSASRP